jgi:hypothetical protein
MPMLQKGLKIHVTFKESSFEEFISLPQGQGLPSSWLPQI